MVDPRTPVLVGTGQLSQRVDRGEPELEPVDLLVEATKQAERDTEGPDGKVLAAVDSVRMVSTLSWRYRDPARLVAERLGLDVRHTVYTHAGGQTPQALLSRTCRDIIDGKLDVALIGGAEAWRTRMSWRARGERPAWTRQPDDVAPTEMFGTDLAMVSELEQERGVFMPVQVYPMFESALRAADGRSPEEHRLRVSELWARFSEAAAGNPNAWIQQRYSAEAIRTAGPDNRMIGLPYPKLMNSNNAVEQAAALLVCSVETAERLAVPRDRWVFVHAGADAADTIHVSNRADLYSSPAIRQAGRAALELGGAGIDDIAHIDLYSCFPSAVQVAAAELGLSVDDAIAGHRPLTVTGGLSFAGGPWNNYVTHSIATMANRLRQEPGSLGLVTANGGFLTKHAVGIYSTEPPKAGVFGWANAQPNTDASFVPVDVTPQHEGPATVEAYTVMHDRDGKPETALAAVRTADGYRAWASTDDRSDATALTEGEWVGRTVTVADGSRLVP